MSVIEREVVAPPVAPAPSVDPVGELLERAADYIEKHGWCQGNAMDEQGRVCAIGSIYEITIPVASGKWNRSVTRLRKNIGCPSVARWNDDTPGRTQQEVVRALREAAARTDL